MKLHPVACHCHGSRKDDTCPTRWNNKQTVGNTNCRNWLPHRSHPWLGMHPHRRMPVMMACHGVTFWEFMIRRSLNEARNPDHSKSL